MKIRTVKPLRDAIRFQGPVGAVKHGSALVVLNDGMWSKLDGALAAWLDAHLKTIATDDVEVAVDAAGTAAIPWAGKTIEVTGWETPTAPPPPPAPTPLPLSPPVPVAAPAAAPVTPTHVPVADLPLTPATPADWATAIANARQDATGALPAMEKGESTDEFSARALAPLGMTIADAIASKLLTIDLITSTHPTWTPVRAAIGAQTTPAT